MPGNNRYKKIRDTLPFPKSDYQVFYNRVASGKYTVEQAANPERLVVDRRGPDKKYWDEYEGEKPEYKTFKSRVNAGLSYKDAMSLGYRYKEAVNKRFKEKKVIELVKTHKQIKESKYNPEHYFIRVTMLPEEAKEYHRTYRSMIHELEEKIYSLEDTSMLAELNQKLDFIKQQYQVFLSFNPIIPGANN